MIKKSQDNTDPFGELKDKITKQVKNSRTKNDNGRIEERLEKSLAEMGGKPNDSSRKFTPVNMILPKNSESVFSNGKKGSLHVKTPCYLPLTESFIYNYLHNLRKYPPLVLSNNINNIELFRLENPIICSDFFQAEYFSLQGFFKGISEKFHPGVLHIHFGHEAAESIKWTEGLNLPLIASFYGIDGSKYLNDPAWRNRFERLFAEAAGITVVSRDMQDKLIQAGCPSEKLHIIHLGTNLTDFQYKRREINPGEPVKFLCAGELSPMKGFDDALRAFASVNQSVNSQLRIVGGGVEDEKLRALAADLQIERKVFFLGEQPPGYIREEMWVNHILLAPSKTGSDGSGEDTPLALIEAQASGMPVISTYHAGIPEVVQEGITGALVSEGDWRTLAEKMEQLTSNPDRWGDMGVAGRKNIEADYNIIKETEKLEILYQQAQERSDAIKIPVVAAFETTIGRTIPAGSNNERLHIAVEATALEDRGTKVRGIGRYMLNQFDELLRLKPDWRFTICGLKSQPFLAEIADLCSRPNCTYINWRKFHSAKYDLLYMPNPIGLVSQNIIELRALSNTPIACTFYDLIPLIFQDMYINQDEEYRKSYIEDLNMLKKHCHLYLSISQCTANDLNKLLKIPRSELRVIYAGVADTFTQTPSPEIIDDTLRKFGLVRERFMLFTGVPEQRKNAMGMFQGLVAARSALGVDLKLAIVGDMPDLLLKHMKKMEEIAKVPQGAVVYTNFVSEEELKAFYHSALAMLFPSMYEGFGFPIVEANSAGLPVIAGNNSSQVEVAGDAALLVNAFDFEEISQAIVKIWRSEDLRNELVERGLRNYKRFTWRNVAEKTAAYISEFCIMHSHAGAWERE